MGNEKIFNFNSIIYILTTSTLLNETAQVFSSTHKCYPACYIDVFEFHVKHSAIEFKIQHCSRFSVKINFKLLLYVISDIQLAIAMDY